jgi:hypothetical protein
MQQDEEAAAARARAEGPAAASPRPWEDHQGLSDEKLQGIITGLFAAAFQPAPPPGPGRPSHQERLPR